MPRAILKNGQIQPIEPLPADWAEGEELIVESADSNGTTDSAGDRAAIDRWLEEMDALCADSTPEEEAELQAALDEIRLQGKELMRRKMGLPE